MINNQTVTKTETLKQAGAMNSKSDIETDKKPDTKTSGSPASTAAGSSSGAGAASVSTASASVRKKSNGVLTGLMLGLILVAVALGVGLWWQQQRFEGVAKEIATRLQQTDQQLAQANQKANQALTLADTQRGVVDRLSRELAVTSNELRTLQQAWEAANEGLDQTLLLNDLKRLITLANQELVLFGSVSSAASILSSVDSMLSAQSAPALKNLQQAIVTDLARLRAVPPVDVTSLSARLDSLIELTGKAPLLSPTGSLGAMSANTTGDQAQQSALNATTAEPVTGAETPWWSSWNQAATKISDWTSDVSSVLLREFADVMSIRKADDPQALLLSEEQAVQLKANVRAMLLSAQLALMTRQPDIWRSELSEVQSILNTRYDTQALDTKASVRLLGELLDAPLATDVPQITDTLSALASAERSLSIPAEAESSATPAAQSERSTEASTDASSTQQTTATQTMDSVDQDSTITVRGN